MTLKETLEKIWQEGGCRYPLHRTRWLAEPMPSTEKEADGVHRTRGVMVQTRRFSNGAKIRKAR
jgi:hypothetical protein